MSFIRRVTGTLFLVMAYSLPISAQTKFQIKAFDRDDFRGAITLTAAGEERARIQYAGSDQVLELPLAVLPDSPTEIQVSGNLNWTHYARGAQKSTCRHSIPVVDLTPLVQPLRASDQPWDRRLTRFLEAQEKFEERYAELTRESRFELDPGDKATAAQLTAAEQRLGFPLPSEHRQVLTGFGAWRVDDSFTTPADQLQNAFEQMVRLWETPRAALQKLSPKTQTLLKTSVILFTQVGDGYGALLYQPPSPGSNQTQGTYFWAHQEELNQPKPLKNRDGSLKSYSQAMTWLLAREALQRYESGGDNVFFADGSSPVPHRYELFPEFNAQPLTFTLRLVWEEFE